MNLIRTLASKLIDEDAASQSDFLYDVTWILLKNEWLKDNQPAMLECLKAGMWNGN